MTKIDSWMLLHEKLTDMIVRASEMARAACRNGEFYWLARYDCLREVVIELEPIALSDSKVADNSISPKKERDVICPHWNFTTQCNFCVDWVCTKQPCVLTCNLPPLS